MPLVPALTYYVASTPVTCLGDGTRRLPYVSSVRTTTSLARLSCYGFIKPVPPSRFRAKPMRAPPGGAGRSYQILNGTSYAMRTGRRPRG